MIQRYFIRVRFNSNQLHMCLRNDFLYVVRVHSFLTAHHGLSAQSVFFDQLWHTFVLQYKYCVCLVSSLWCIPSSFIAYFVG